MKHSVLTAIALALLTLAGCSDNETDSNNPDKRTAVNLTDVSISATISTSISTPTTRATDNAWQANDAIGLTLLEAGTTTPVDGKTVCKYVTATANGKFVPANPENTAYYPAQGEEADVFAFYPYRQIDADLLIPVSTADQTSLSRIDLMVADKSTGHSDTRPDVALNFRHKLVKLLITVDREASAADVDLSSGATLTLRGTATTAQWSLAEEKLIGSGTATDLLLPVAWNATQQQLEATAIVLPTAADAGVTLIVSTGKKTFEATLPAEAALVEGTVNTLRVHLRQTEAVISATVTDWTTGATIDLETLPVTVTATDGTAAGINALTLWTASAPTAKAEYTFDATTAKWNSATPFYLESLAADEAFYARHTPMQADGNTPATDAVSGLADVLGNTVPATLSGGGISLELKHLYAKLNVTLLKGTDFPATISTAGATLTLNGFKQNTEISDENVVTAKASTDTRSTDASAAYTLPLDNAGNASLLVAPQSIAAGTTFVVQLKNTGTATSTYTFTLGQELVLEGGKIHTLSLTLTPTAADIRVSTADWGTGVQESQTISIGGITDGNGGVSGEAGYTPAEGDLLTIAAGTPGDNATAGNSIAGATAGSTATYTYSAATGTWSSLAPLYWDALPQAATYTFSALLTPAAADTPEKDYMAGTTTATFGSAVRFSGDNALTHLMSRLTIFLKPGTGYTADDMKRATVSLLKGYTVTEAGPAPGAGFTTTKATKDLIPTHNTEAEAADVGNARAVLNTLTLCPQSWPQGAAIFSVQMKQPDGTDGATYTVRATAEAGFTLLPGKEQAITATIGQTGISLSFAVVPWGSGSQADEEGDWDDPAK